MSFTYGEIERIFASLHCANEAARKTTLRSRIKHFQKLGVPFDLRSGRGKKLTYDRDHIYQFAVSLELANFGIDPSVIVAILRHNWKTMFRSALEGKNRKTKESLGEIPFFMFSPEFMNAAWYRRTGSTYPGLLYFDFVKKLELQDWLNKLTGDARRLSIINIGETIRMIDEQIALLENEAQPTTQSAIEPDTEAERAKQFEADRRRGEEETRKLLAKIKSLREKNK